MELSYDPRFSLEDTAAQIDLLEGYIGVGDEPFIENETVAELQGALQNRVAFAASELMTGMRWHSERQQYLDAYAVYRRLLGAVALDTANRTYDEYGDVDRVKKQMKGYLKTSKLDMVALDYGMRLERSSLERAKQKIAQSDKTRLTAPYILTTGAGAAGFVATTLLLKSSEVQSFSAVELSPTQRGIAAAATVASGLLVRSAVRSGSRQVGVILGSQFNSSLLPYLLDKFDADENEDTSADLESLIGKYAMRHLKAQLHETGDSILEYDMQSKEDIQPMVKKALDVTETAMHKSYAVDPKNEWPGPWYLRLPSKILRVNLASS